jgi:hypothetical protein
VRNKSAQGELTPSATMAAGGCCFLVVAVDLDWCLRPVSIRASRNLWPPPGHEREGPPSRGLNRKIKSGHAEYCVCVSDIGRVELI